LKISRAINSHFGNLNFTGQAQVTAGGTFAPSGFTSGVDKSGKAW